MPDFGDIEDKAKQEAASHQSDVDKGVNEAENQVDQRTGDKNEAAVSKAGDEAEAALGADPGSVPPPPPS